MTRAIFWSGVESPHLLPLVEAMRPLVGSVVLVLERAVSADRAAIGWDDAGDRHVDAIHIDSADDVAALCRQYGGADDVHIISGLGSFPLAFSAIGQLTGGPAKIGIIAERPNHASQLVQLFKAGRDKVRILRFGGDIDFFCAMGDEACRYYGSVGVAPEKLFSFGYFPQVAIAGQSGSAGDGAKPAVRFAAVGSHIGRKGFDLLIDAVAKMGRTDIIVDMIGGGPDTAALQRQAKAAGLVDQINWRGRMGFRDVWQVLRDADCAVVPSRHDGWGAVTSEALQLGTPVVVTDACGSSSVIIDPRLGAVVPPDAAAIAAAMTVQAMRPVDAERRRWIEQWAAQSLSPLAGARHLASIIDWVMNPASHRPTVAWAQPDSLCHPA